MKNLQEPDKRNDSDKNNESINTEESKKMITDNVSPAIRSKFPKAHKAKPIYILQGKAKLHSCDDDEELLVEGSRDGWCIQFKPCVFQCHSVFVAPSIFKNCRLIDCVQNAFNALTTEKLDNVFLTLQKRMELTMMASGATTIKLST